MYIAPQDIRQTISREKELYIALQKIGQKFIK
jgi:hypothetical protein